MIVKLSLPFELLTNIKKIHRHFKEAFIFDIRLATASVLLFFLPAISGTSEL